MYKLYLFDRKQQKTKLLSFSLPTASREIATNTIEVFSESWMTQISRSIWRVQKPFQKESFRHHTLSERPNANKPAHASRSAAFFLSLICGVCYTLLFIPILKIPKQNEDDDNCLLFYFWLKPKFVIWRWLTQILFRCFCCCCLPDLMQTSV